MNGTGTRIHIAMPRTLIGRVIAGLLTVGVVVVALFFFAALFLVAAALVAGYVLWSALAGKKKQAAMGGDEDLAEYEVLKEEPAPAAPPKGGLRIGNSDRDHQRSPR